MIIDLEPPPQDNPLRHVLYCPKRRQPRETKTIELDTPIIPRAIAEAVLEEAQVLVGEPLPRRWLIELTRRANEIYSASPHFRQLVRAKGNTGRDKLWAFTRHWLSALIQRDRPHLTHRLPSCYSVGRP